MADSALHHSIYRLITREPFGQAGLLLIQPIMSQIHCVTAEILITPQN